MEVCAGVYLHNIYRPTIKTPVEGRTIAKQRRHTHTHTHHQRVQNINLCFQKSLYLMLFCLACHGRDIADDNDDDENGDGDDSSYKPYQR